MIIDPSKIRRGRQTSRKSLHTNAITTVEGLHFDGRKDKTRNQIVKGDKFHPVTETEEHIVLRANLWRQTECRATIDIMMETRQTSHRNRILRHKGAK